MIPRIKEVKSVLFISYAREDSDFVKRLSDKLVADGIEIWVDFTDLTPGTQDWERAIRSAARQSFAMLLIASPHSRQSEYVHSEVLLIQAENVPIYPIWATGEAWIHSIPFSLGKTQYLDFRGNAFAKNYPTLIELLQQHSPPNIFLYENFYVYIDSNLTPDDYTNTKYSIYTEHGEYKVYSKRNLNSYAQIRLEDITVHGKVPTSKTEDVIFVNPSKFNKCTRILDTVYMELLRNRFPMYSYGINWVLIKYKYNIGGRVMYDWPNRDNKLLFFNEKPENYGLVAGSQWFVSTNKPLVAIAINHNWLLDIIESDPKAAHLLIREYFQPTNNTIESLDATQQIAVFSTEHILYDYKNHTMTQKINIDDKKEEIMNRFINH